MGYRHGWEHMEVLTRREVPVEEIGNVELPTLDDGTDYEEGSWFCLATLPWPCPNPACSIVEEHVTARHLIVVWPARDDRALLRVARQAQENGREPRVMEYEAALGPCISWDRWHQLGSWW